MKNIDSDLIRGNIDTIILKTMLDGDKYGLDIIKEVEARSNGTYELKQPTLYSCLKRLENQQLISSYWLDSDIGGRRHYYKLTEKGHETLEKKQEEWAKSKFIIDNLLSNFNYDEYRLVKKDDYDKIIEGKQFVYEKDTKQESPAPDSSDEDYEQVNAESDIDEFNELESSAEQENYHDNNKPNEDLSFNFGYDDEQESSDETDEQELSQNDDSFGINFESESNTEKINPLEPSTKRLYYVDIDDDEISENKHDYIPQPEFDDIETDENDFDEIETEQTVEESEVELDSHEYVSFELDETDDEPKSETKVPEMADQTSNELNILQRLRTQDDEEINTYYGDQKSYVNHINKANEELDNVEVVQPSILDYPATQFDEEVSESINEFENAIKDLTNFNTSISDSEPEPEIEINEEVTMSDPETEPEENISFEADYIDDFNQELSELNRNKNNGFFNSTDNPDYEHFSSIKTTEDVSNDNYDFDFSQTDSSDATMETEFSDESSFENDSSNEVFNFNISEQTYSHEDDHDDMETTTNLFDIDKIISNNASSYSDYKPHAENDAFTSFTPKYTSENYKQKLSNLSAYSKVSSEDLPEKQTNQEALAKATDIESLKSEFEQEGIKFKEYKRYNSSEQAEKTYLLSNKIKLVNSLILLFGYVFILSALYIILNNTGFKDTYGFSIKWFLYAFIPFGAYTLYHLVMYIINPYKKTQAKLAPRILIFISLIITVQLLLITYCVNLQLGFYSFTQEQYNHLFWVIPAVVSFAPIFCNVAYISLFYSKNFNV